MHNAVSLVNSTVTMLNLTSVSTAICISGAQYLRSLKRKYYDEIEFERELINKHLDDIRLYKQWSATTSNSEVKL